jgi:hypothetical protein
MTQPARDPRRPADHQGKIAGGRLGRTRVWPWRLSGTDGATTCAASADKRQRRYRCLALILWHDQLAQGRDADPPQSWGEGRSITGGGADQARCSGACLRVHHRRCQPQRSWAMRHLEDRSASDERVRSFRFVETIPNQLRERSCFGCCAARLTCDQRWCTRSHPEPLRKRAQRGRSACAFGILAR